MKKLIAIIVALVATAITASAQNAGQKYVGANPVALKVYNGYTGSLVLAVNAAGTNVAVTVDGLTTTLTVYTNFTSLCDAIANVTNRSNEKKLIVDNSQSLPTDTAVGQLVSSTQTVAAGAWAYANWNTSLAKWYQVSYPSGVWFEQNLSQTLVDPERPDNSSFNISSIYGFPNGTGDVQVTVYIAQTNVVYQRTITSPIYVEGAGGTNVASHAVNLDIGGGGVPVAIVPGQKSVIVRATRATGATGGNIGIVTTTKSPF